MTNLGPLSALMIVGILSTNASATMVVLHVFSGAEGTTPLGPLASDKAGDLYGVSSSGGAGFGTIWELSPPAIAGGTWTETTLYTFSGGRDGAYPNGGLTFDGAGNLYGTTLQGGACLDGYCGVVFELTPSMAGNPAAFQVLYAFPVNQGYPNGRLAFDTFGNLYGSAQFGGLQEFGNGYVVELSPPVAPATIWTEANIHEFKGFPNDGALPYTVILDSDGTVYGTTNQGGSGTCFDAGTFIGCGTAYQLSKKDGTWVETIIHDFSLAEDSPPYAGLRLGPGHVLYGPAGYSVYQLTHSQEGWTKSDVYQFPEGIAGSEANSSVTLDRAGNLYGTSTASGIDGYGTAYILKASDTLPLIFVTLSLFPHYGGPQPNGGLVFGKGGVLYGVADSGAGVTQSGYVFATVP